MSSNQTHLDRLVVLAEQKLLGGHFVSAHRRVVQRRAAVEILLIDDGASRFEVEDDRIGCGWLLFFGEQASDQRGRVLHTVVRPGLRGIEGRG